MLLGAFVAVHATIAIDHAVTIALQAIASSPLDLLANANTLIGQSTVTAVFTAALALALWRRGPGGAWLAAGFIALTVAGEVAFKFALDHPGPPHEFARSLWNPFGVHVESPSSFPSGHVARVTFLAVLLGGLARGQIGRGVAAVLVGYTLWARVYIGDHWVSDALGGLALGAAAGLTAIAWIIWCRAHRSPVGG